MRLATRATKSFDLVCPTINSYTTPAYRCLACRSHVSRFSTSTSTSAKFTDRIRRTLWKSDKPPGANDPYNQSLNDDAQESDARAQAQAQDQEPEPYDDLTDTNSKAYQEAMKTYQPATTWEGLTEIGDIEEPEFHFASWKGTTKLTAPHDLSYALRRAIIEVLVLQSSQARTPKVLPVGRDYTRDADIVQSDAGPVITFADSNVRADIIRSLREKPSLQEAAQAAEEATTNPTDAEEAVKAARSAGDPIEELQAQSQATAWEPVWLQISLQDPAFKFSVLKRTSQLTGVRLSDSAINSIQSVQDVLSNLITPPKPRTIIEALSNKKDLLDLPNVTVLSRRWTPIDKEVSVGRWKVIEKELQAKGLPTMGAGDGALRSKRHSKLHI